jgi:23S rRNA pseudouridine2605 synthase
VAKIKGRPSSKNLGALSRGIELEGRKTWPADIEVLHADPQVTTIKIVIHEGRKRQVRKMFAAVGHPVLQLKRTAYGQLELGDLAPGKYRFLSPGDIKMIFRK